MLCYRTVPRHDTIPIRCDGSTANNKSLILPDVTPRIVAAHVSEIIAYRDMKGLPSETSSFSGCFRLRVRWRCRRSISSWKAKILNVSDMQPDDMSFLPLGLKA